MNTPLLGTVVELRLRAMGVERALKLDFAILLTAQTMRTLHKSRYWHAL